MVSKEVEKILPLVQKPGRYIGGELNSVIKDKEKVALRYAFCFPDSYEIGMSHLGMKILYSIANEREDVWCERVFAPWHDMEAQMRKHGIPLCALESGDAIKDFDLIAFTLMYELSYSNVLNMLDLAGLPVRAADRHSLTPIVIGGGPCACNPEPMAEFFDIFSLGEGEEVYVEHSFAEIADFCKWRYIHTLSDYVELNEGPEIWDFLLNVWKAMKQSIEDGLAATGVLPGGLNVQRKANYLYHKKAGSDAPALEEFQKIAAYAYAVAEQNADNGTIVTAPTCGACGVLPAVLKYVQDTKGLSDEAICRGLATAGIIGNLTKSNASISGAECGCQAEIGTACSMAAAALAELYGQDLDQVEYAAEVAMEHHLGLTCDPICGLVQIPCIERNAVAAMRAMNACNLSYFLTGSRNISYDMVCRAMHETGINMNQRFRETSEGGLAKLYDRKSRK